MYKEMLQIHDRTKENSLARIFFAVSSSKILGLTSSWVRGGPTEDFLKPYHENATRVI
jgi:hypothetical protein